MRPSSRNSFEYRVYCALVCYLKVMGNKAGAIEAVTSEFNMRSSGKARRVYNAFVRPQLAAGKQIRQLF